MIRQNLHTHTIYSDGKNTPEEIILSAKQKGFTAIGFSEHAYAPYDSDCCMKQGSLRDYFAEITRLKQKYAGEIEVYLGIETDGFYETAKDGFNFTIGSMHYFYDESTGEYLTFDYRHDLLQRALQNLAGGSVEELVRQYYAQLTGYLQAYRPDIAGHIDLIKKLNGEGHYYDPKSLWYRRLTADAAEKIATSGCIVEVNTGGISRGYISEPYPSGEFLSYLFELGVPVTVSADAHTADMLDFWFDEAVLLLKKTGYRSIKQLTATGFIDVEL